MSGCQTCNSCQGCNSCQSCNSACNSVGCNTVQAFCYTTGQNAGSFDFNQCVSSNETFLTKTNWNRLIAYINSAYKKGNSKIEGDGGDSGLPEKDDNIFMTAEMFNLVSQALCNLGTYKKNEEQGISAEGPQTRVNGRKFDEYGNLISDGDIIYGTYFEDLEKYANVLQYKQSQCDTCNTGCNVTCKDCQSCNAGGCQTNSPSSCCSYCNTCQSCNTCQNQTSSGT